MDEKKYTKNYNFQIKDGWDGQGYIVFSQDFQFNSFKTNKFTQGMLLGDIALLFNNNFELDKETIGIIKLLIKKGKKKKKLDK